MEELMRVTVHRLRSVVAALPLLLASATASADVSITLKNDFIEANKNRATMEATYMVVRTHHKAKPAKEDGDIHCAGTSDEVGLACVAEVMNAKDEAQAVQTIVEHENGAPLQLVGVWRVWPEHATGGPEFIQGDPVDPIVNTNPPHVFELHPLVTVGNLDVRDSFKRTSGYRYKDAATAFGKFESLPCRIEPGEQTTSLVTNQIGYNYVDFTIELLEDPAHALDDGGLSVYVTVPADDPEVPLVSKLRCIFVAGTTPEQRVRQLHAGDRLRVVGIPRVDLALLSYRAKHGKERPQLLSRTLPYEMVIVAVLSK
jgi:hypothetical protein